VGTHHSGVRAVDGAGNADPTPATRDWTVVPGTGRPHTTPPAATARPPVPAFTAPEGPRVAPP